MHKNSIITILAALVFLFLIPLTSPRVEIEDPINIVIELSHALVCAALLFKIEEVRFSNRKVYLSIFASLTLLLVGSGIDFVDEFFEIGSTIELIEDLTKNFGFLLFIFSCFGWVSFHKSQYESMQRIAEIDSLTGILNRRSFLESSQRYLKGEESGQSKVSLLLMDIDHFKKINDSYGHQFGDRVLVDVASTIKSILRKDDYFARIGGEEFVVLLKNTEIASARNVAEKIRLGIEQTRFDGQDEEIVCTVSIGITVADKGQAEFDDLFNQADKALYSAKAKGRNCVVSYPK